MSDDRDLSGAEVVIEAVEQVDDDLVAAFGRLTPQLSSSPAPDRSALAKLVATPGTVLFVARMDGEIVGSLTLVTFHIPTGQKAWIEDVVVDEVARGKGVGELLSRAALAEATARHRQRQPHESPVAESANRLYLRIGFEARETNVYRYSF